MSENENATEDEIIVELTNHLNSVYPNESGRFNVEGGELSSS